MAAGNRKERRARDAKSSATSTGSAFQPTNELDEKAVDYILKHPDRSGPKGKTLLELAEERQRELDEARPYSSRPRASGVTAGEVEAIGPIGDTLLYSTSMAALHVTLDVIVYSQYREDIVWREIAQRAATAVPIFFLLVYLSHVDFSYRFPLFRNLAFLVGSVAAGCSLVYSGNKHGYFLVMKSAPPLGTLWIWSVVEMSLPYAALSAAAVMGYVWYYGFTFF